MTAVGIIAEYNPFHNGHAYHLAQAKMLAGAETAVVVMSGNFVQVVYQQYLINGNAHRLRLRVGLMLFMNYHLHLLFNQRIYLRVVPLIY